MRQFLVLVATLATILASVFYVRLREMRVVVDESVRVADENRRRAAVDHYCLSERLLAAMEAGEDAAEALALQLEAYLRRPRRYILETPEGHMARVQSDWVKAKMRFRLEGDGESASWLFGGCVGIFRPESADHRCGPDRYFIGVRLDADVYPARRLGCYGWEFKTPRGVFVLYDDDDPVSRRN